MSTMQKLGRTMLLGPARPAVTPLVWMSMAAAGFLGTQLDLGLDVSHPRASYASALVMALLACTPELHGGRPAPVLPALPVSDVHRRLAAAGPLVGLTGAGTLAGLAIDVVVRAAFPADVAEGLFPLSLGSLVLGWALVVALQVIAAASWPFAPRLAILAATGLVLAKDPGEILEHPLATPALVGALAALAAASLVSRHTPPRAVPADPSALVQRPPRGPLAQFFRDQAARLAVLLVLPAPIAIGTFVLMMPHRLGLAFFAPLAAWAVAFAHPMLPPSRLLPVDDRTVARVQAVQSTVVLLVWTVPIGLSAMYAGSAATGAGALFGAAAMLPTFGAAIAIGRLLRDGRRQRSARALAALLLMGPMIVPLVVLLIAVMRIDADAAQPELGRWLGTAASWTPVAYASGAALAALDLLVFAVAPHGLWGRRR